MDTTILNLILAALVVVVTTAVMVVVPNLDRLRLRRRSIQPRRSAFLARDVTALSP
jgi:hypothetical protein